MVLSPQRAATEYLILKKWAPLSAIQFPLSIELSRCFLLHLAVRNWLNVPGFGLYSRRWVKAWKRVVRFREKSKEKASTELSLFSLANWLSEATDILGQMLSMWCGIAKAGTLHREEHHGPALCRCSCSQGSSKQQAPLWRDSTQ